MNYVTHNDTQNIRTGSSWRVGTLHAPYRLLVLKFGEPMEGDGYKVDAEWGIKFEDGTVAFVYNYKTGRNYNGDDGMYTARIREWSIGGTSTQAVDNLNTILDGLATTP